MLTKKEKQNTVEELELDFALHHHSEHSVDHYPLTCTRTPENGVWMLGNLNTCRFMPLSGSESSNLMTYYEGKKSMSMISWSRKGTQAN